MNKITIIFFILIFGCTENSQKKSAIDLKNGFVPDSTTARQIAEIIFINVYGEDVLNKKPFNASLKNGVWIVEGTLDKDYMRGVPRIEISQDSCKVLRGNKLTLNFPLQNLNNLFPNTIKIICNQLTDTFNFNGSSLNILSASIFSR